MDAVRSTREGRLSASVAQLPHLVGKEAVENITVVLQGDEVETFQFVDTLVLTKRGAGNRRTPAAAIRPLIAARTGGGRA